MTEPAAAPARIHAAVNIACAYRPEPPGRDRWQTPDESLRLGTGDCEDFAIAYWWHLRHAAPRPAARLARLDTDPPHMVCLIHDHPDPLVLDVLSDEPYRLSERVDGARVVFELGADADATPRCWIGDETVTVPSAWADVLARMSNPETPHV